MPASYASSVSGKEAQHDDLLVEDVAPPATEVQAVLWLMISTFDSFFRELIS